MTSPLSRRLLAAVALAGVLTLHGHVADVAGAQQAVVRGVLVYDPACVSCEVVLHDVLPPLEARYGEQLDIVKVDASTVAGFDIWSAGTKAYRVPNEKKGVPLLFLGDRALSGEFEIAEQLLGAIQEGIEAGGIPLPPSVALTEADTAAWAAHFASPEAAGPQADPLANGLAVAVLAGAGMGLVFAASGLLRSRPLSIRGLADRARVDRSIAMPLLAVVGLLFAGYLSYLHLSRSDAICPVGNCDAVQHSPWARLFGVPVAYLGFLTYAGLLGLWVWGRYGDDERAWPSRVLTLAVAAFGTAFSAYLTILELVVIHAVCMWCLASAVVMTFILITAALPLFRSDQAPSARPAVRAPRAAHSRAGFSELAPEVTRAGSSESSGMTARRQRRRKKK